MDVSFLWTMVVLAVVVAMGFVLSRLPKIRLRAVFGLLLGVLFSTLCLLLGAWFIFSLISAVRSSHYPIVQAHITSASEDYVKRGPYGSYLWRSVAYEFTIGSHTYQAEDIVTAPEGGGLGLSHFSIGSVVPVYYAPRDPSHSFLQAGEFSWLGVGLGAVFLLAGIYGIYRISKRFSLPQTSQ